MLGRISIQPKNRVKISHVQAGQGWRCVETQHSVALPTQRRRTRRCFDAIRSINNEGFDHGQTREFKYSSVDRIEDRLEALFGPLPGLPGWPISLPHRYRRHPGAEPDIRSTDCVARASGTR
jgi:hypothetical protein